METSKLSFPAPAEAGIEISFHNDVAAGAVSATQSADWGEQRGADSDWLAMDFLSAN